MLNKNLVNLTAEEKDKKDIDNILKNLIKARVILISELITDKLARSITGQALIMQEEDPNEPITVYVNSPGGSADSGFAIYDVLRFITPPVITICTGLCASAAVLIYVSAHKNRRFSLPNSRFLLHQPSTTIFGPASDIEINANEIIKLRERYNKIIAAETDKTLEKVTKDSDRDFWLSSEEAMNYGLIGKIIQNHKEIKESIS